MTIQEEIAPGVSNLHLFIGQRVDGTEVETGLPLGHEVDSSISFRCVRDDSRSDGGIPEMTLLRTTPSVGVGQHELSVVSYRVPPELSNFCQGGDELRFRRIEEIAHNI